MKEKKDFLRKKLIEFQLKILDLSHILKEREDSFRERENKLFTGLFEVLDAFENVEENINAKEDRMDKTARRLAKNVRTIRKKLVRLLKANGVVRLEFSITGQVWIPVRWWRPGLPKRWKTKQFSKSSKTAT